MAKHPSADDLFSSLFVSETYTYRIIRDTPIQADVHIPKDARAGDNLPVFLLFHGGSLISGHRRLHLLTCGPWVPTFAAAQKAIIVIPDYRLAPETKTPDILTDLITFWEWLHTSLPSLLKSGSYGITPDLFRLLIRGESAGGWCALHLSLLYAKDIRATILAWPMVDLESDWFRYGNGGKVTLGMPPCTREQVERHLDNVDMDVVTVGGEFERFPIAIGGLQNGLAYRIWGESDATFVLRQLEGDARSVRLPSLVWVTHGKEDTAAPVEGSEKLVRLIGMRCPDTMVRFDVRSGEHGFDNLIPFEDEWLQGRLEEIAKVWLV